LPVILAKQAKCHKFGPFGLFVDVVVPKAELKSEPSVAATQLPNWDSSIRKVV
jgi:hypothetical protein